MVQVDVFWAYGLGASLAAASAHLSNKQATKNFFDEYFAKTVLFLSLVWAPTGLFLLLRHPSWESMQAAEDLASIPHWIVMAFGITNITQGILGYWIGKKLIDAERHFAANINWMLGYFGMFFILLYGWDGLGYDRFLYDRDMLAGSPAWTPGAATAGGIFPAILNFITSSAIITLLIDGVYLIPIFAYLYAKWQLADRSNKRLPSALSLITSYTACVFIAALFSAGFTAVIVGLIGHLLNIGDVIWHSGGFYAPENLTTHIISYLIGIPIGVFLLWFTLYRPGMPFHALISRLIIRES